MKAIIIPSYIDDFQLIKLNDQLKNCHSILYKQEISKMYGSKDTNETLIIVDTISRKDKLKIIDKISNE